MFISRKLRRDKISKANTGKTRTEEQRKKLFARNDFKEENKYSSVHPDALADGDKIGRGTGNFDQYDLKAGTSTDIFERKDDLKSNKYSSNNPYYTVK